MSGYRLSEQGASERRPIADGVVMRIDGVYEVDPDLMEVHVSQQSMPVWETKRIIASRTDHLNWMHRHFAEETIYYGSDSEATDDVEA